MFSHSLTLRRALSRHHSRSVTSSVTLWHASVTLLSRSFTLFHALSHLCHAIFHALSRSFTLFHALSRSTNFFPARFSFFHVFFLFFSGWNLSRSVTHLSRGLWHKELYYIFKNYHACAVFLRPTFLYYICSVTLCHVSKICFFFHFSLQNVFFFPISTQLLSYFSNFLS